MLSQANGKASKENVHQDLRKLCQLVNKTEHKMCSLKKNKQKKKRVIEALLDFKLKRNPRAEMSY